MVVAEFNLSCAVRGHHVYKDIWTPFVNEELTVVCESGNIHNPDAVSVMKGGTIVGHMPRSLSRVVWFYISHGGTVKCIITGHRKFGVGLEVPCIYEFKGHKRIINKLKKLINDLS